MLKSRQCLIKSTTQVSEFIIGILDHQAFVQVLRTNLPGSARHRIERLQCTARKEVTCNANEEQCGRQAEGECAYHLREFIPENVLAHTQAHYRELVPQSVWPGDHPNSHIACQTKRPVSRMTRIILHHRRTQQLSLELLALIKQCPLMGPDLKQKNTLLITGIHTNVTILRNCNQVLYRF